MNDKRNCYIVGACLAALLCVASSAGAALAEEQEAFATPDEAAHVLVGAIEKHDREHLARIFGPDKDLLDSGDRVADDAAMDRFVTEAREKLDLQNGEDGSRILVLGHEDWPFPIPLLKGKSGWTYDTQKGRDEILTRRIGRNELDALDTIHAYVDAQRDFFQISSDGGERAQYAQRFLSDRGKRNGLFWPRRRGEAPSPLGPLVAQGVAEGYSPEKAGATRRPFHGYNFRILKSQGPAAKGGKRDYVDDQGQMSKGFGLIAFPVKWGNSGVMTFIVNQDGRIYEKDLGPQTEQIASAIDSYNPEKGWNEVK